MVLSYLGPIITALFAGFVIYHLFSLLREFDAAVVHKSGDEALRDEL